MTSENLKESVKAAAIEYLQQLDGLSVKDLYKTILAEIEESMLKIVMDHVNNNQSKAAKILGLSRGTTRKKLKKHGLIC